MEIWLTIEECLGTDGEYSSDVCVCKSGQEAGELRAHLIATMAKSMGIDVPDPTTVSEIKGDGWWYRVRIQEEIIQWKD